jgi:hypothetical protein
MNYFAPKPAAQEGSSELNLVSEPEKREAEQARSSSLARSFLGIHFQCCQVYARIFMTADRTAYRGSCPRCGKPVVFRIGEGGTSHRFFEVY